MVGGAQSRALGGAARRPRVSNAEGRRRRRIPRSSAARRRLNEAGGHVVQGSLLAGVTAETPFWDAGIYGDGQIVGCGDTGADRNNCYLSDPDKFVMYRDITAGGSTTDEEGHGTHVVGSIAGRSDEDDARADGVARNARVAMTDMASSTDGVLEVTSNMGSDFFQHAYDAGAYT